MKTQKITKSQRNTPVDSKSKKITTTTNDRRTRKNETSKKYRLYSGWKRDGQDHRDLRYTPRRKATDTVLDLRSFCPPVYNQGPLGSCTTNAIGFGYHFDELKQRIKYAFMPSRLFIYWNERFLDGTVNEDAGSEIRTGIKTIGKQGVCSEDMWPYDVSQFTKKPSDDCFAEALKHRAIKYMRVDQDLEHLKACLQEGFPIVFGFNVFTSFESAKVAKTGMVPMPKKNEKNIGGHAVAIVGFDDNKQCFIVRNSWGADWGDGGYCYMPYAYITNKDLCDDFWTIRLVSASTAARARKKAHQLRAMAA
jgi:C1A family cysteine protease